MQPGFVFALSFFKYRKLFGTKHNYSPRFSRLDISLINPIMEFLQVTSSKFHCSVSSLCDRSDSILQWLCCHLMSLPLLLHCPEFKITCCSVTGFSLYLLPLLRLFLSTPEKQLWLFLLGQKCGCVRMGTGSSGLLLDESVLVTCFHEHHSILPPLKELYPGSHRVFSHIASCLTFKTYTSYWIFRAGVMGKCFKSLNCYIKLVF